MACVSTADIYDTGGTYSFADVARIDSATALDLNDMITNGEWLFASSLTAQSGRSRVFCLMCGFFYCAAATVADTIQYPERCGVDKI